jgi:hypothetical protein
VNGAPAQPHPDALTLALFNSGDLGFWNNWTVGRHVRACETCRRQVQANERSRAFLHQAAEEMPANVHWGRMAAEMRANIKLGLAVGAIAGPVEHPPRPLGWRIAAAVACVVVLTISGWWLHMPRPTLLLGRNGAAADNPVLLRNTRAGIELEKKSGSLVLVHHGGQSAGLTVGVQGELGARYVDEDTGEVTIHRVYAE